MSAPTLDPRWDLTRDLDAMPPAVSHVHMPSVHVRNGDGSGFDYTEDLVLDGDVRPGLRGTPQQVAEWAIGELAERFDLSVAEVALVVGSIQFVASEAQAARMAATAAGERQCADCGCSNSHACPGGCVWATEP
jgi:hypothetical protein